MIWHPGNASDIPQSALAAHLMGEIETACDGDMPVRQEDLQELASTIEYFLNETSQNESVESRYLVLLASRALFSMGEEQTARRLMLFGTGLFKPSEWEVSCGKKMWILDLKQMTLRDDDLIELTFFNCLNIVLEATADIWDKSLGEGVLGLQNICCAASALLHKVTPKKTAVVGEEIRDACRLKLEQLGGKRGWASTPEVMNLDI